MNREAARARLVAIVEQATHRPKSRRATRPGKGQREQRLGEKRERSEVKAARQRRPSPATTSVGRRRQARRPEAVRVFLPRSHVSANAHEPRAFAWNAFRRPASRAPAALHPDNRGRAASRDPGSVRLAHVLRAAAAPRPVGRLHTSAEGTPAPRTPRASSANDAPVSGNCSRSRCIDANRASPALAPFCRRSSTFRQRDGDCRRIGVLASARRPSVLIRRKRLGEPHRGSSDWTWTNSQPADAVTRFKELRPIEAALEHRDTEELRWALGYCGLRPDSRERKSVRAQWHRLAQQIRAALSQMQTQTDRRIDRDRRTPGTRGIGGAGVPSALVWSRPTQRQSRKACADGQTSGRAMLRDPACIADISRSTACRSAERVPGERTGSVGVRADVRAQKEYPHRLGRACAYTRTPESSIRTPEWSVSVRVVRRQFVALAPRVGWWPGSYMSRHERPTASRMPTQWPAAGVSTAQWPSVNSRDRLPHAL